MSEMMGEVAENVGTVRVPDTAHFIAEENPSAMVAELLGFLSAQATAG
jgi:pimeloyl-ACP methyl ester carboxylesterase